MATATVTALASKTMSAGATPSSSDRATSQGGIIEGGNPSDFDPKHPLVMFIIQAGIILITCRLLHFPLSKMRQPRVIAEVIGGIILGPSVMGRIPGFKDALFPEASMPPLALAANLGLVLFLFLVGLEVDLRFLVSNWRIALSVGAAGMALPFGLGGAIAWGLYHQFRDEPGLAPIGFGVYMLFIGVAMAITAFPVLCRILTELKLLATPVGVIVLSAGVGNDVVGWILLALCVALVNSGTGITGLYVLLAAVGYTLFLIYAVRPAFLWILRRNGSLQNGPTQAIVALTLLLVLTSAFFTGAIGIHPIFGAFMIGLICPHEGGFAIKLTEKIEDLVSVLLLPLYFALSGLSTNLGLLDDGITWAYVVGVIAVAFIAKIAGGTLASKLNGLVWRESLTIGALMSCKGLVELIVLNIGLQAKILSTRTFTIFVVMALVTTFATTPLTALLYPKWYQEKLDLWKKGKIDWDGNPLLPEETNSTSAPNSDEFGRDTTVRKVLVYLRLDGLPSLFTLMQLMGERNTSFPPAARQHHLVKDPQGAITTENKKPSEPIPSVRQVQRHMQVHGLRLIELTERESSVMAVSEIDEYATRDPIVKAFRTFGKSKDIAVAGSVAVIPEKSYSGTLLGRASELSSDLVLIPWSETESMSEQPALLSTRPSNEPLQNRPFTSFVTETFKQNSVANIAIFVDRNISEDTDSLQSPSADRPKRTLTRTKTGMSLHSVFDNQASVKLAGDNGHHLVVPFLGGPDDCFAIRLALQLAKNESVVATIIRFDIPAPAASDQSSSVHTERESDDFFFTSVRDNLSEHLSSRVVFQDIQSQTAAPYSDIIEAIGRTLVVGANTESPEHVIISGRGNTAYTNCCASTSSATSSDTKALGKLNTAILEATKTEQIHASLMVVQAKREADSTTDRALEKKSPGMES